MNKIKVEMSALSENVSIARVICAAFITPLDPSVEQVTELKTAVSEAVTNAVIHGYAAFDKIINETENVVTLEIFAEEKTVTVKISDKGIGIENIASAREPLFTTKPEMERSGLGFTVMEEFVDTVDVISTPGEGTTVTLIKKI